MPLHGLTFMGACALFLSLDSIKPPFVFVESRSTVKKKYCWTHRKSSHCAHRALCSFLLCLRWTNTKCASFHKPSDAVLSNTPTRFGARRLFVQGVPSQLLTFQYVVWLQATLRPRGAPVEKALPEDDADERRNASEYCSDSLTWCVKNGTLSVGLTKIK